MTATWGELPTEILISIMSYLDAKELARMGNVNYHWKRVCEDDSLWRPLLIRDYLLPRDTNLKVYDRWVDEYKLLKFDSPINLSENLRDCPQGITNVAFSPDGKLFCTTANDGSFKIWTATRPTYLIHERYLDESLGWERALFSKFSADSKSLLVSGIKQNQNGEIAVFTIDADEAEVHFSSRVKNNPADVNACWYNNSHLIISDLFTFNHNSIIGSSISLLWICSGASALNETNESVLKPLLRIPNQRGGYCQMFEIAQYIPTRLRSVVYLSRQAALEKTTLTAKMKEVIGDIDEKCSNRSELIKERLDELCSKSAVNCAKCSTKNHCEEKDEDDVESKFSSCDCCCHRFDDRLLIYANDDSQPLPPHSVAFKIIDGTQVKNQLCGLPSKTESSPDKSESEKERNETDSEDRLSSILSSLDLPDHIIDLKAHVMGITLSSDQRYLYVNVTHDKYTGEFSFDYLAEVRVINLSSMTFEKSYFGHFASVTDRFNCSVGKHYIASASLDGCRVWSKQYHCIIARLLHGRLPDSIALNPFNDDMIVTVDSKDQYIKIWTSKKKLTYVAVENDFM